MTLRNFTTLLLVNLLIIFLGSAPAQLDTLTIIHVNDTHSNLLSYGGPQYGGISRAASMIGQWKMTEPNPILLHNGDFMVGTLMFNAYFGVPELQILQQLGCDALVLGNHEFDAGPTDLGNILAEAQLDPSFDILCSNAVNTAAVPLLNSILRSYAIEQRGNMKVGIFGLTTPTANVISNPAPVFVDTLIVETAMQCIAELEGQGCNLILMMSHLGLQLDREMAQVPGIDAIIGGHTHDILVAPEIINGIPIVQAGEFYDYVGKLRLTFNGSNTAFLDYTLQEIGSLVPSDPGIDALLQQLQMGIVATYTPVIGDPSQAITYAPKLFNNYPTSLDTLDTPVGNLFTKAMHSYMPTADCALEPSGHIVEEIYPGPVTTQDLFRCYPYGYDSDDGLGFRIATFDLLGSQIYYILQGLLFNVNPLIESYDYLAQSDGLDYSVYFNPTDQLLYLTSASIQGIPVIPDSSYTVVSSDRVVGYLQGLFGITPGNLNIDTTISVFQVVKEYVEQIDTLNLTSNGHILVGIENTKPANVVQDFELLQNYPNPFNPETVISFNLPSRNRVRLEVYNCLGQKVRTLLDKEMAAGNHEQVWNGQNDNGQLVGSGIYFYKIVAGNEQRTKKMILMH